ncbi:MAG TPA: hypothetical protein VFF73_25665 [Planctomycetota bacterium]|nr:hypothetical protein [Planctomycetota bacterium]
MTAEDRVLGGMKVLVSASDLSLLSSKPSVRKVVPAAEEMNRVVYPETGSEARWILSWSQEPSSLPG